MVIYTRKQCNAPETSTRNEQRRDKKIEKQKREGKPGKRVTPRARCGTIGRGTETASKGATEEGEVKMDEGELKTKEEEGEGAAPEVISGMRGGANIRLNKSMSYDYGMEIEDEEDENKLTRPVEETQMQEEKVESKD